VVFPCYLTFVCKARPYPLEWGTLGSKPNWQILDYSRTKTCLFKDLGVYNTDARALLYGQLVMISSTSGITGVGIVTKF
jgi:hypothetical protein